MRGVGVRGTSIAQRKADLERIIDIAQSSHVDRGEGVWERITSRGDKCVYAMPTFGDVPVRVPFAHVVRAALITHFEFAEYDR